MSFSIGAAPALLEGNFDKAVVDESRDVTLQRVSGLGPGPGDALILTWAGRPIPMNVQQSWVKTTETPAHYVTVFETFGGSPTVAFKLGIEPFSFTNAEQKHEAQMLAVEALLVFGSLYNGLEHPDGYYRVDFDGRQWFLSDFGYTGAMQK